MKLSWPLSRALLHQRCHHLQAFADYNELREAESSCLGLWHCSFTNASIKYAWIYCQRKVGTLHHKPTCLLFHRLEISPKRAINCHEAATWCTLLADWNCHTTRFKAIILNFDICILFILDAMHSFIFSWWRWWCVFHPPLHSNGIPDWTTIAQTLFTSRFLLFDGSPYWCPLYSCLASSSTSVGSCVIKANLRGNVMQQTCCCYSAAHERPCHLHQSGLPWTPKVHSKFILINTNLRSWHPIWRKNAIATNANQSYRRLQEGKYCWPVLSNNTWRLWSNTSNAPFVHDTFRNICHFDSNGILIDWLWSTQPVSWFSFLKLIWL